MNQDQKADLILRNAILIDGSGDLAKRGDLAILNDRILAVGDVSGLSACKETNVGGNVVCPGFVDTHTHDDLALIKYPHMDCKVSQGVTTVVTGNCGISIAPLKNYNTPPSPLDLLVDGKAQFFEKFTNYFDIISQGPPSLNSIFLVGHTNLRVSCMDSYDRPADKKEILKMQKLLEQSLEEGVCGMSTGLFYSPAKASSTSEIIELAKILYEYGALYTTHMRDEGEKIVESLRETFFIGAEAEIPVVISHHKCSGRKNHGRSLETLDLIDEASKTLNLGLDAYPYNASSTVLSAYSDYQSERVLITWSESMPEFAGKELSEVANELGVSEKEAAEELSPGGAIFFVMDENDVRRILSHSKTMIGSDGLPSDTHPHPRLWGTFPRVLGYYVRDVKLFGLEEAVRKMTSLPAACFGIKDRGFLKSGNYADLVIFDPQKISDTATFEDPISHAIGIDQVMVNGRIVWENGEHTGNRPGRPILL